MVAYDIPFVVNITVAIAILISTIPAISSIFSTLKINQNQHDKSSKFEKIYEDEDGAATVQSESEFSQKWSKALITVLTVTAFAINVAVAVISTLELQKYEGDKVMGMANIWLGVAIWVRIFHGYPSE